MNDSIFRSIEPYLIIEQSRYEKPKEPEPKTSDTIREMFFFDPNTASEDDLQKLGLTFWQAGNILKYRDKGGEFRSESDLSKIYGIDSTTFQTISPWVRIENINRKEALKSPTITMSRIIELNSSDSSMLVDLPGIGPIMASRIIKFRQALGGYCTIRQLLEIYGMNPETFELIEAKVAVDTNLISRLSLNFSDYDELAKHPYISGTDARNIIKFRNKNGSYETCSELESKKVIDGNAYNKLRPYLKVN